MRCKVSDESSCQPGQIWWLWSWHTGSVERRDWSRLPHHIERCAADPHSERYSLPAPGKRRRRLKAEVGGCWLLPQSRPNDESLSSPRCWHSYHTCEPTRGPAPSPPSPQTLQGWSRWRPGCERGHIYTESGQMSDLTLQSSDQSPDQRRAESPGYQHLAVSHLYFIWNYRNLYGEWHTVSLLVLLTISYINTVCYIKENFVIKSY